MSPRACRVSSNAWWVATLRPRAGPASCRSSAPVQTLVVQAACRSRQGPDQPRRTWRAPAGRCLTEPAPRSEPPPGSSNRPIASPRTGTPRAARPGRVAGNHRRSRKRCDACALLHRAARSVMASTTYTPRFTPPGAAPIARTGPAGREGCRATAQLRARAADPAARDDSGLGRFTAGELTWMEDSWRCALWAGWACVRPMRRR
jgi:hypothetical protein